VFFGSGWSGKYNKKAVAERIAQPQPYDLIFM